MDNDNKPTKETMDVWHNDPNIWKLGVFYFNKEDKRIFPPKRMKYAGWTINFANPYSVLALLGLVVVIVTIVKMLS